MSDLFHIQTNDSVSLEDACFNSSTNPTNQQHHQISQTIFWCLKNHMNREDDMNIEVIDISDDDDEEEDENTCKSGTSIDDSSEEEEIEVIQLSDDDDEANEENSNQPESTLNNQKIGELSMNEPLDLTFKTMHQLTNFDPSTPSTSQTEQQQHEYLLEEVENNTNRTVSRNHVLTTLGLSCRECSKLFDIRSKLDQHLLKVHKKLLFKCMIRGCNEQFAKKSFLNQHYAEHSTNQTKLTCSAVDCQFETLTQPYFSSHVYLYHEKGHFQCPQCLVTYSRRITVFRHYTKAHKHPQNIAHRLFQCSVNSCRFAGRNNFHLKQHQLTQHTKLRPFRCTWPGCGFCLNYRSKLIEHIRVHHFDVPKTKKEAVQRNIQCELDPYSFVEEISFET